MNQTHQIVDELKRAMKSAGVTYAMLARQLHLSEASVKRMFHKRGFSLHRLETACTMIGIDIAELAARASAHTPRLSKLTSEQELRLLENPKLMLMIYMLLNQWTTQLLSIRLMLALTKVAGYCTSLRNSACSKSALTTASSC